MKFNKLMIPILVLSTFTTMCSKSKDKTGDIKFSDEKIIDTSSSLENEISEKIKSNNVFRDPTNFKLISMKDAYSVIVTKLMLLATPTGKVCDIII